jgi:hypothetical protein
MNLNPVNDYVYAVTVYLKNNIWHQYMLCIFSKHSGVIPYCTVKWI